MVFEKRCVLHITDLMHTSKNSIHIWNNKSNVLVANNDKGDFKEIADNSIITTFIDLYN